MKIKKRLDQIFFYIFTIIFILFIYFYYFNKNRYDQILDQFFNKENKNNYTNLNKEKDYQLLFYSYLFFYISYFIIMPVCRQNIYSIAQKFYKKYSEKRLYDLGHAMIPYHKYSKYISEIIVSIISISILIIFILHPNIKLLYSLFFIYSILTILKGCFFNLTLLPDASQECTFSKYFGSCNDLFFSGHTAKIFVLLLLCDHYDLIPNYISYIYYILFGIMMLFILSARNHYSIDIFIGIIMALVVYCIYYQKIKI